MKKILSKIQNSQLIKKIKQALSKAELGKNKFNTLELILIFVMALVFGILIGEMVFSNGSSSTSLTRKNNSNIEEITNVYNTLIEEYINEVNEEDLKEAAIEGMLNLLGDNYSLYYDEAESEEFKEELTGTFYGIGAEVYQEEGGLITVYNVFENSPATKAGLEKGDEYLKINGEDVTNKTSSDVADMIKGKNGETITLNIRRGDEEKELKVTTAKVEIPSVSSEIINQNNTKIGYMAISIFAKNTDEQFSKHLETIEKEGINKLIIDLRSNNGGELETVINIASNFLNKDDVVVQTVLKDKTEKRYSIKNNTNKYDIVVLINGQSASGAEVLASALNENCNAELVGTTTYGKGTVQRTKTLSSGDMIKYTVETWKTSQGKEIEGVGIKPTIEVELSETYYKTLDQKDDNQLQTAIETILTK